MLLQYVVRKKTNININNTSYMKQIQNYLTPEISEYEIRTEGVLCVSSPGGAGSLDDNSWDLTFGETNN